MEQKNNICNLSLNIYPVIYKTKLLLTCPANEIFMGGSLGGAKSTSLVLDAGLYAMRYPKVNLVLIRQSFTELLNSVITKFEEIFPPEVYVYKSSYKKGFFCNGSIVNFGYIESDSDLFHHQSVEYQYLGIDEATHNTEYQHRSIKKRVRSSRADVPTRIVYTANPGGYSHKYFYDRFMKDKNPYQIYKTKETAHLPDKEARTQCFIKSGLIDNKYIFENDPTYKYQLQEMTEADKEMYLFGNWESNAGQFFKEWNEDSHIIDSYELQDDDTLFITADFGTNKPSAIYWVALTRTGRVVAYRELYTIRNDEADTGLNIPAHSLAKMILDKTPDNEKNRIKTMYLDNSCWNNLGHGSTTFHLMQEVLPFPIVKTNKARVDGWQHFRYYLEAKDKNNNPYFQCTKNCVHLIRTMPIQIFSKTLENDIDTKQEDHAQDSIRYFLINRPKPKNYSVKRIITTNMLSC